MFASANVQCFTYLLKLRTVTKEEILHILREGDKAWEEWTHRNPRRSYFGLGIDLGGISLRGVRLSQAYLAGIDFSGCDFEGASITQCILNHSNLSDANLAGFSLNGSSLINVKLDGANAEHLDLGGVSLLTASAKGANLRNANLRHTDLSGADFSRADLTGADMTGAKLDRTKLTEATLDRCKVYGTAVWKVELTGAQQKDLQITDYRDPLITIDNLKVAQFVHLLLENPEVRDIIDTISSKVVLILGRFTPERKAILDALRENLRQRNYLPILFDFSAPKTRDVTETISTLAHIARFIIADITDARSVPQELAAIVPALPSVPVQPILSSYEEEYGMFEHFTRFPWVLPVLRYSTSDDVLKSIDDLIGPAERRLEARHKPTAG